MKFSQAAQCQLIKKIFAKQSHGKLTLQTLAKWKMAKMRFNCCRNFHSQRKQKRKMKPGQTKRQSGVYGSYMAGPPAEIASWNDRAATAQYECISPAFVCQEQVPDEAQHWPCSKKKTVYENKKSIQVNSRKFT